MYLSIVLRLLLLNVYDGVQEHETFVLLWYGIMYGGLPYVSTFLTTEIQLCTKNFCSLRKFFSCNLTGAES